MKRATLIGMILGVAALLFAACETKQQTGTLAGAGLGAAAGAAVGDSTGALIGGLIGGVVGSEVGRAMDERDREQIYRTLEYNPAGQPTTWQDPDDGHRYRVTPVQTFDGYQGYEGPCRSFEMDIWVEGRLEQGEGVACRQPDGSWQIIG